MKLWPHGALVVYLVALGVGVLTPHPPPVPIDPELAPRPPDGLVADAIRNLVLMLPLGWLLAALGRGARFAALLGFLLSLGIETAQTFVPGRFPSAVDVVTNTLSTAAGALLYSTRRRWLLPEPGAASRLALGWSVAVAVGLVAGVQLLRLSPGRPGFDAGWRPELGQYEPYAGAILGARIGDLALPVGRVVDGDAFTDAFLGGIPLVLEAEQRPSAGATAPLFTVHDRDQNEVLLVAAQGTDLLFEQRTRALDFGLDQPAHRWAGAIAVARLPDRDATTLFPAGSSRSRERGATDAVELRIERSAASARLSIAGRAQGERDWPPGRVWGLLIRGRIVPAGLEAFLDGLTIALLALPCAYYARRTGAVAIALGLILVALPQLGPVSLPRAPEWLGLAAGLAIARLARVVSPRIVVLTSRNRSPDSFDEQP